MDFRPPVTGQDSAQRGDSSTIDNRDESRFTYAASPSVWQEMGEGSTMVGAGSEGQLRPRSQMFGERPEMFPERPQRFPEGPQMFAEGPQRFAEGPQMLAERPELSAGRVQMPFPRPQEIAARPQREVLKAFVNRDVEFHQPYGSTMTGAPAIVSETFPEVIARGYSSGGSQYGAPAFVSESSSEMIARDYSSGGSQYGAPAFVSEPSSEMIARGYSSGGFQYGAPAFVSESFPGMTAQAYSSGIFQYGAPSFVSEPLPRMTTQAYPSERSQFSAPAFVSEPLPEMTAQVYASERSHYDAEPPPTWSHRLSSVSPELKTPDRPQRKRRGSDPSSVQESFPGITAPNHPSKRFQYDFEAPPIPNDSLATVNPTLKTRDKPQSVRFAGGEPTMILEDWYQQNWANPYPTPDVIDELMSQTKFMKKKIQKWFSRRRYRDPSRRDLAKSSTNRGRRKIFLRIPRERQENNIFQCTYCYRGYPDRRAWDRHEYCCGSSEKLYVCMKTALSRTDNEGNPKCPFCGGADSSDQHLNDKHRHGACLQKSEVDRQFTSRQHLQLHFKRFHRAKTKVPKSWCVWKDSSRQFYRCGFCGAHFGERAHRTEHIAAHFQDTKQVFDMTRWKSESESPRSEFSRMEPPHPEPPRSKSPRSEPSGSEFSDSEFSGSEFSDSEFSGSESSDSESPRPDSPQSDSPQSDSPQSDSPQPDSPRPDSPRPESPRPEAPRPDSPRPEAPRPEAPRPEAPRPEAPRPDAPRLEAPRLEPSRSEPRRLTPESVVSVEPGSLDDLNIDGLPAVTGGDTNFGIDDLKAWMELGLWRRFY